MDGRWLLASSPAREGSFSGERDPSVRGLVRCVQVNIGPFGGRYRADSIDAALMLQHDAGLVPSLPCLFLGDVNLDGAIDSIDAMLLLQRIAGLIDQYPPY